MKVDEIRKMSEADIKKEIAKSQAEIKALRDELRVGKEKDVKKSLKIKRNIARMLTVLRQLEMR